MVEKKNENKIMFISKTRMEVRKKLKTKMNSRKLSLILVGLLVLFLLGLVSVSAVPSLTLDTTTWTKDTNVSIALTDGNNVTYVAILATSSTTDNSSTKVIANITNTTATNFMARTKVNFTFGDDILLTDSNDYSITATTTGTTTVDGVSLSATTVTIDRTVPSITSITDLGTSLKKSSQTISFTLTNATSWKLFQGNTQIEGSTITGSASGNTQSKVVKTGSAGSYYVTASDSTNTTTSSTSSYKMVGKKRDKVAPLTAFAPTAGIIPKTVGGINIIAISAIAIIILVIVFVTTIGRKRR